MSKFLLLFFVSFFILINLVNAQNGTNGTQICGNNICEFNETISCPSDCDNCSSDLECEDNDLCTIDKCEGIPKNCTNILKDCDDNNPATTDGCILGKCESILTTNCRGGDNYCPDGCDFEMDSDCPKENSCDYVSDCDDNNPCTDNSCEGIPKICVYKPKNGCIFGNQCVNYGKREEIGSVGQYCDKFGKWINQKIEDSLCDEDYECITNSCSQGKCIAPAEEPEWWEKIIGWITNLIGLIF